MKNIEENLNEYEKLLEIICKKDASKFDQAEKVAFLEKFNSSFENIKNKISNK